MKKNDKLKTTKVVSELIVKSPIHHTAFAIARLKRPLLQIALDTLSIHDAINAVKVVEDYIDVVEVGTILLTSSGKKAMFILKACFPNKIIVADMKIADAGSVFGKMAFDSSADLVTVICAADLNTIKSVALEAKKYDHKPEIQIELTAKFTKEDVMLWKKAGASHVVYHRSRDAQLAGVNWTQKDLDNIGMLHKCGMQISITGGLCAEDIKFFKETKPSIFIAGRTIRGHDALNQAKQFRKEILKYFKNYTI